MDLIPDTKWLIPKYRRGEYQISHPHPQERVRLEWSSEG